MHGERGPDAALGSEPAALPMHNNEADPVNIQVTAEQLETRRQFFQSDSDN
jgi:hypothetical protein